MVGLLNSPKDIIVPGAKDARSEFLGAAATDEGTARYFPKNIESCADSTLMKSLIAASLLLKEIPTEGEFELPADKLLDSSDLQSKCFWQGVIKGFALLMNGQNFEPFPKKDPFKSGIWYVQARVLLNLKLDTLAIRLPKRRGIFDFTCKGKIGFNLAESIKIGELINAACDTLKVNTALLKSVLLKPNDLKSLNRLRHKRPSEKKVIYTTSEIKYLSDEIDPAFKEQDSKLEAVYETVADKESYDKYVATIKSFNKKIAEKCTIADKIAVGRYPVLFKRGMTGNLEQRLQIVNLDELASFYPGLWQGLKVVLPMRFTNADDDREFIIDNIKLSYFKLKDEYIDLMPDWLYNVNMKLEILRIRPINLKDISGDEEGHQE